MEAVNREDIQGMLIYGYKYLPTANYLFLSIIDKAAFKNWLKKNEFQNGVSSPKEVCMNIAFTSYGLQKLGLTINEENGFSRAFIEGIDTEQRNRILGDFDANDSADWDWGNHDHTDLHCVLILFAKDQSGLDQLYQKQVSNFSSNGVKEVVNKIESIALEGQKEHFGFKDGISQPVIRGLGRTSSKNNYANPGEFILGYQNDYGKFPHSPKLQKDAFDFGKNGSYMVYRQLEQNVPLFWNTMYSFFNEDEKGKSEAIALASKMVGRWPNGNPLTNEATDNIADQDLNKFSFYEEDKMGMKCPFGSHIRRTNPRDSQSNSGQKKDLQEAYNVTNKHRILRRGRPYGNPLVKNMDIEEMHNAALEKKSTDQRGLNFICFNSDIDRQFEFVQQTWANNRKFHDLYDDVDPIIGVQRSARDKVTGKLKMTHTQFEEQARPVRKRYKEIPPFIKVKGGAYLFMPGLNAIKYLGK